MVLRWRDLDPRRWSRGLRALTVFVVASVATAAWAAPRALVRWETHRADRRFDEVALPRVAADVSPLYPGARVRVTADAIDLDLRARTAALPEATRRRVWNATEPLWRDALLVESRGLVRLHSGRLRNEDERRRARQALTDRWLMASWALDGVDMQTLDYRTRLVPILYFDARVPMATLREVWLDLSNGFALALRGPRGVTVLSFESRVCAPIASVELVVSAARFLLRATPERGGCTGGPGALQRRETVIDRDGGDRGIRQLREALASGPWMLDAMPPDESRTVMDRMDPGPWGAISMQVDEDLPVADLVAAVMAARERSPGSCHDEAPYAGCLFPYLTLNIPTRSTR